MSQSQASRLRIIKIDSYLTESKLSKALQELSPDQWSGEQVPITNTR
jgi:hypothetical protein